MAARTTRAPSAAVSEEPAGTASTSVFAATTFAGARGDVPVTAGSLGSPGSVRSPGSVGSLGRSGVARAGVGGAAAGDPLSGGESGDAARTST